MQKHYVAIFLLIFACIQQDSYSQSENRWTAADRDFLVSNLERTKLEIIRETQKLSQQQWSYKKDSTSWSISQVLEHLGLYERIFMQEADIMLSTNPDPELDSVSLDDKKYIEWMDDPGPHKAEWNAEPLGFMDGSENLEFFLFGRNHIISFIKNTTYDLKAHHTFRWGNEKRRSIHALMVVHFAHTDRHLRQIKKIKSLNSFPK